MIEGDLIDNDEPLAPVRKVIWDIETNDPHVMHKLLDEETEVYTRQQNQYQYDLLQRLERINGEKAVRDIYSWTTKKDLANGDI